MVLVMVEVRSSLVVVATGVSVVRVITNGRVSPLSFSSDAAPAVAVALSVAVAVAVAVAVLVDLVDVVAVVATTGVAVSVLSTMFRPICLYNSTNRNIYKQVHIPIMRDMAMVKYCQGLFLPSPPCPMSYVLCPMCS